MKLVKDWISPAGNEQKVYMMDNGYGASVVRGEYTYGGPEGLYELAVLKFESDDLNSASLCYDTDITDDVLGNLTVEEVDKLLERIEAL